MRLFYLLVATTLLISCSESNTTPQDTLTAESAIGTWIFKMIDGEEQLTDGYFAVRFNEDLTQDYYAILDDGNGSSTLSYTQNATYYVENSTIYVISDMVDMELVGSITTGELCGESGEILIYTELKNIQNGVDYCESRSFAGIRCNIDYSSQIIGLWDGSVIEGDINEPFDNIRLDFKENNIFDFYYQATDGSWVLLEENNNYAILGNLFGSQWAESETITAAETWETTIDGDTMTWRATREGVDYTAGFDLVRVVE